MSWDYLKPWKQFEELDEYLEEWYDEHFPEFDKDEDYKVFKNEPDCVDEMIDYHTDNYGGGDLENAVTRIFMI